jgi:hypothetical protein
MMTPQHKKCQVKKLMDHHLAPKALAIAHTLKDVSKSLNRSNKARPAVKEDWRYTSSTTRDSPQTLLQLGRLLCLKPTEVGFSRALRRTPRLAAVRWIVPL